MSWAFIKPKRPEWLRWSGIVAIASLVAYGAAAWWAPWAPGRVGGLIAGTLAAAVFVVDGLYPLRRRLLAWPLRNAQQWLQFHLYGGVIAALLVWVHIGFRLPGGWFGWMLLGLTMWTTFSGLVGVWLQKWVPALIVGNLSVEALAERIPELVERLQREAERVAEGASDMLTRTYTTEIRPRLAGVTPSWSYLFDIRGSRERQMRPLQHVAQFLVDEEQPRLADLQAIYAEKTELEAHLSLQRALRVWTWIHVPPALLLLGLMTVHIVSVLYL